MDNFVIEMIFLLVVIDSGFSGFRSAAGRNPLLKKWSNGYYPKAIGMGLISGICLNAFCFALWYGCREKGLFTFEESIIMGRAFLDIMLVYTTIVLSAFVPYFFMNTDVSSLITTTIFGPLTLFRPIIVLLAMAWALYHSESLFLSGFFCVFCGLVLSVERVLLAIFSLKSQPDS